jgi:hypothetical protein
MDRFAHARVCAAATNVGHGRINVLVGGLGFFLEQRHRNKHLATLAIAALRHLVIDPSLLDCMQFAFACQAFDAHHLLTIGG